MQSASTISSDISLTWDLLTILEPNLLQLQSDVSAATDTGGRSYCANSVWVHDFKPRLCTLVGTGQSDCTYHQEATRIFDGFLEKKRAETDALFVTYSVGEYADLDLPSCHGDKCGSLLCGRDAYDIGYDAIYKTFKPGCRNCGCL